MQDNYTPGYSAEERRRLLRQASVLAEFTGQVLRDAGLEPGMRVLDLGCGLGDVTLLAARMVGPGGSVTGVDRNQEVLGEARHRAERQGLRNVTFVHQPIEALSMAPGFDAVVGRLVLMHVPKPADALRCSRELLRSGGIAAFIETDMEIGGRSAPPVPLYDQCLDWIRTAMRRTGVHTDMGMSLYRCFGTAGLPRPQMRFIAGVGGGEEFFAYEFYAEMVRVLLPWIERLGIATPGEVGIDDLASRMRAAATAAGAQLVTAPVIAAWARKECRGGPSDNETGVE